MGKMNIDKLNSYNPIRTERQSDVKKTNDAAQQPAAGAVKETNEDRVNFSGANSGIGKLVEKLKEMPDIRQEKVEGLRDQISAGQYNPSSEEIADAILRDERS